MVYLTVWVGFGKFSILTKAGKFLRNMRFIYSIHIIKYESRLYIYDTSMSMGYRSSLLVMEYYQSYRISVCIGPIVYSYRPGFTKRELY